MRTSNPSDEGRKITNQKQEMDQDLIRKDRALGIKETFIEVGDGHTLRLF